MFKRLPRLVLACCLSFAVVFSATCSSVWALTQEEIYNAAQKTIQYYHDKYQEYEFKGILDWPAVGLFGFGEDVNGPKWTVSEKNGVYWREQEVREGIGLSKVKNTDYQRTIIGACAAGQDPRNFGNLNLVEIVKQTMLPSGHFADSVEDNLTEEPVGEDLVNAHVFGVIALHCAGEPIPNRDKCLQWLEEQQHPDGGFTFDVKYFDDPADYELIESDVDMTAGALMAFAILGEDETNSAVKKALDFLHEKQQDSGGFASWGTENVESCAWVVQALTLLGQDPMGSHWTKPSGENPVSAMLKFQLPNGGFTHVLAEEDRIPIYDNGMSTEQALYGMADAYNKKAVYDILHEKYRPEVEKNMFTDFKPGQFGFNEGMDLVYSYVLTGYPDGTFRPDKAVTRAEFSKFLVYGLGLKEKLAKGIKGSAKFSDITNGYWADECIGVCVERGYIRGTGESTFSPKEHISGEQLMAAIVRAANLEKEAKALHQIEKGWSDGVLKAAAKHGFTYDGFAAKEPVTRAQSAWAIAKLRELKE